jgi:hypothetical protein
VSPCQFTAACPSCLDWAVANDEVGYWGGTTERARRRKTVEPEPPPAPPADDTKLSRRTRTFHRQQRARLARIDPADILLAVDRGDTLTCIANLFGIRPSDVLAAAVPRLLARGWTLQQITTRLATNRRQVERYQTGKRAA